jgi:hypothetical protein
MQNSMELCVKSQLSLESLPSSSHTHAPTASGKEQTTSCSMLYKQTVFPLRDPYMKCGRLHHFVRRKQMQVLKLTYAALKNSPVFVIVIVKKLQCIMVLFL